jgi:hypothetical protein
MTELVMGLLLGGALVWIGRGRVERPPLLTRRPPASLDSTGLAFVLRGRR